MDIGKDIGDAAELAAPEIGISVALAKIVVVVLAVVGIIAGPIAIYEDVEINGLTVPFVGWHITDGLRKEAADAERDRATALANQQRLQGAINTQNAAIDALDRKSKALQARVDDLLAAAAAGRPAVDKLKSNLDRMKVDRSSAGAAAISLGQIMQAGAQ